MSAGYELEPRASLPRPSRALTGVMLGLLALWIVFAVGINWGGASDRAFRALAGNTSAIVHGEVWRLVTAPLLHNPISSEGVQHIAFALLGLYLIAPPLEQRWGTPRLLWFLGGSAIFAYSLSVGLELLLPSSIAKELVPPLWFGTMPVLDALMVAFALTLRDRQVMFAFIIPVTGRTLIWLIVALNLALVLARAMGPSGQIAPLAGMLAGWLFGSDASPLRRRWLRWQLDRLDAEAKRDGRARSRARQRFEVIPGGRDVPPDRKKMLH